RTSVIRGLAKAVSPGADFDALCPSCRAWVELWSAFMSEACCPSRSQAPVLRNPAKRDYVQCGHCNAFRCPWSCHHLLNPQGRDERREQVLIGTPSPDRGAV